MLADGDKHLDFGECVVEILRFDVADRLAHPVIDVGDVVVRNDGVKVFFLRFSPVFLREETMDQKRTLCFRKSPGAIPVSFLNAR